MSPDGAEQQSHTAPQLSLHDECDLTWFFTLGQIAFEHSAFGAALERAELFSISQFCQIQMQPVFDSRGEIIGWERVITARPTAETHEQAGYVPDIQKVHRYARVSRLLMCVERMSRTSAQVLELLHGDMGQRWAENVPYGRLGALFHLTAKGRQLVNEARNRDIELNAANRMEVIVKVQKVQPKADRAQALAYCQRQSKLLEQEARAVWHAAKRGLGQPQNAWSR